MYKQFFLIGIVTLALAGCGGDSSSSGGDQPPADDNTPPEIGSFPAQSVDERQSFSLEMDASDSDGSIASYQWQQLSGPTVSLDGAAGKTVSFDAPTVAEDSLVQLEATVTDDSGTSASETVDITIVDTHIETTLAGRVNLGGEAAPDAEVAFDHGEIHRETRADSAGEYAFELAIPLDYSSTPYRVEATVEGLSLKKVGLIDELLLPARTAARQELMRLGSAASTRAPAAAASEAGEQPVDINEVTTAEAALLQDLFDSETQFLGNLYNSLEEYAAQYSHINSQALLDIASFILYLRDEQIAPPDPLTLDSLYQQLTQLQEEDENFNDDLWQYAGSVFDTNAGPEAFERIIGDGGRLMPVIESAPHTVRVGEWFDFIYNFAVDGTLTITNFYGEKISGTWTVAGSSLEISTNSQFRALPGSDSCYLSDHETWNIIQERGIAMDSVMISRDVVIDEESTCGADPYTRFYPVSLYTESHILPLSESDLAGGTFAVNVPNEEADTGITHPGYLLHFSENGSGQVLDTGGSFSWAAADNILTLSFPDGSRSRIHKVQDDGIGGAGIIQVYESAGGTEFVDSGLFFRADPALRFEEADLASKGLRSGSDASRSDRDISFVQKDFYNLEAGGSYTHFSQSSIDGEWRDAVLSEGKWEIDQKGRLVFPRTTTEDTVDLGRGSDWREIDERCDPATNEDCWVFQVAVRELIHRGENRYYVREGYAQRSERPEDNQALPEPLPMTGLDFFEVSAPIGIPEEE